MKKIEKTSLALILLVLILGVALRLYKFDTLPFGLNHDGALESLEAIEILQRPLPYKPYSSERSWLSETLFRYYLAFIFHLLGPTPFAAKIASTLITIFTLPVFYLLVKQLFGRKIALFSLFFLSLSGWHLVMGKTVWRAITLPLFETLTFYFLLKALKTRRLFWAAACGGGLSLTLNTYAASRLVPFIITGIVFLFLVKNKKPLKNFLPSTIVFLLSFAVTISPLASYAFSHWEIFNSRAAFLSVTSRIRETGSLAPLLENVKRTVLMFTVRAGGDDFFVNEPLLDFPTSYFFILGLIYSLFYLRKFPYQFTLLGFSLSLLPGLLTVPNGNRNIGVLPFVYLLSGIGLYALSKSLILLLTNAHVVFSIHKKFILGFTTLIIFLLTFINTWSLYLGKNRRELFGFYPETTVVANFMKDKVKTHDIYLTDNYPRDALTFLTYQGDNPFIKHYTWLEDGNQFLKAEKRENKGLIFLMFQNRANQTLIKALEAKFPQGKGYILPYIDDSINRPAAWVFEVY